MISLQAAVTNHQLQLKSIPHSHHVDNKKNSVIRNGSALSGLKIYKLQSDYVDKIHELNLSAVTTLVTVLFNASEKKRIYLSIGVSRQLKKKASTTATEKIICNSFEFFSP